MRGDVDGYVSEFNPVRRLNVTGMVGAPGGSDPKPIWKLRRRRRIQLNVTSGSRCTDAREEVMDEVVEIPLISVSSSSSSRIT